MSAGGVFGKEAVCYSRLGVLYAQYCPCIVNGVIVYNNTVYYSRARVVTNYCSSVGDESACNCKSLQDGIYIFAAVEEECAVVFCLRGLAVDNCICYIERFKRINAGYGDSFAVEVDVPVSLACVCSGF